MNEIFLVILGMVMGYGIRIIYHILTGKDIRLLKYPYIIHSNGSIEKYCSPNNPLDLTVPEDGS